MRLTPRKILHAFVFFRRSMRDGPPAEFEIVRQFLKDDDICFDIGAQGGMWSIPLSRAVPRGMVYAFEALPYYADVLRLSVKLRARSNVRIVNRAVSDTSATMELVWKDSAGVRLTGMTHLAGEGDESPYRVPVQGITLDEFCAQEPIRNLKFIKCDVEGVELMVYRGALKTLSTHRTMLFCELETAWCERYRYSPADVFDFFEALNYRAFCVSQANARLISTDRARYSGSGDVMFIPAEMEHPLLKANAS